MSRRLGWTVADSQNRMMQIEAPQEICSQLARDAEAAADRLSKEAIVKWQFLSIGAPICSFPYDKALLLGSMFGPLTFGNPLPK